MNGTILGRSACELSRAIHAREVRCVDLMEACLARIETCNPQANAIVSLLPADALLQEAAFKDRELAAGIDHGWLHGIPQAPKDVGAVRGLRTTKGSPIYRDQITRSDSITFERMRRAGAIFIGRTNVPEFALGAHTYNPVFGTTHNALTPGLSAGGSSGGAAVAVALNMLPVADGSDQMGSLRIPAAFNNIFGFRPSYGRVPYGPATDGYMHQFSTEGPMARDVPDLVALLAVQAGFDPRSPLSLDTPPQAFAQSLDRDFSGVRVAWLGDFQGHLPMEAGLLDHCRQALAVLERLGCEVQDVSMDFPMDRLWEAWLTLRSFGVAAAYGILYRDETHRRLLKPEAIWEIERGLALSAMEVARAAEVRTSWLQAMNRLFASCEFAVQPSTQVYAFDVNKHWPGQIGDRVMDTYHRWMEVVIGPTLAGLPSLSVPVCLNARGLAAGVQFVGASRSDFQVLQLGHAYDQARLKGV